MKTQNKYSKTKQAAIPVQSGEAKCEHEKLSTAKL